MKTFSALLATLVLLLAAPVLKAQSTVGWGNSPFDTALLDSSGNIFDASYVFELGTFDNVGGFAPTALNTSEWAAHWKLLNSAVSPLDAFNHGWNVGFQVFSSEFTFNSNGTVAGLSGSSTFTTNEQAYIWVYNPAGEWALVTDSSIGGSPDDVWMLPNPNPAFPSAVNWVLDTADTAILGSLNGTYSGGGGPVDYRLQTVNVSVIPEPGSSLMVLLVGCLARVIRSRRRA